MSGVQPSVLRRAWPGVLGCLLAATVAAGESTEVVRRLNNDDTVKGTEQSKSYHLLFDAYLDLSSPPLEISDRFNQTTIHPGMGDWAAVSDWAESNPRMAEAILSCKERNIIGLPYGLGQLDQAYQDADLVAAVGAGESLDPIEFPYLDAMEVIAAFATAEMYRLMEAGEVQGALDLVVAHNWVLRQLCDRVFLAEKLQGIQMLIDALANLRDVFWAYQDAITFEQFRELGWYDIPELRPDRNRLHIPEGDRLVSEALLEEVFDAGSQPDPEKFAEAFATIQSADAPLTRFGAARRWRMIAHVHDSLEASKDRLKLIYDDWWRRWRVQEHDAILDVDTQFERTNPVRYAAVIYTMQNIEGAFSVRNQLIAAVNGTAISAGLCAYKTTYGVYPDDKEKIYGHAVRKIISDIDPYDENYRPLRYRLLTRAESIDTPAGRLRLDEAHALLYSLGLNHQDARGREHSDDAADGDLVLWPPIRALSRDQGLLD
ncbi:MAG: hypothetical protein ACYSU7_02975 [Planctomycetota bacterium]|jgi:hypothetical protein